MQNGSVPMLMRDSAWTSRRSRGFCGPKFRGCWRRYPVVAAGRHKPIRRYDEDVVGDRASMPVSSLVLGIDPGLSGAISWIEEDGEALVYDIPVIALARGGKRKRDYDIGGIVRILGAVCSEARSPLAVIELVHAMPTNGSIGNFSLGRGTGI